jgi:CheY-like chemotaxis protein
MVLKKKRILISIFSKELKHDIIHAAGRSTQYQFETASNGTECLNKIDSFKPDLILIDLLLPELHGIEILRTIKANQETKNIGVIVTSAQTMIQNYHAAMSSGADYFLEKPFDVDLFYNIAEKFFNGTLTPSAFMGKNPTSKAVGECYVPHIHSNQCFIKFWGTRGSNPVSGHEYMRFGGNTCCLEIRNGPDQVIIDAGTGIRPLGNIPFTSKLKTINLLIGHTHWDHITGFPFFAPIYNPDCHVNVWAPIGFERSAKELFTEMLAYAFFPVRLDDIRARLTFKEIHEGVPFHIGNIEIDTHYAYHPGPTLCFKIQTGGKTFGYATDNEMLMGFLGNPSKIGKDHPLLSSHQRLIKFFKGCDFLIHEAQYFPLEYREKVGWGHSSIPNATILIKYCEIKEWIVTHHDPGHTDDDLHRKVQLHHDIIDDCKLQCRVRMAFDGFTIPL